MSSEAAPENLPPLSLLDLAGVAPGETVREGLEGSVRLAQLAERTGFRRVWYAEHHNFAGIASSAPAVLIAHIATHTTSIRLGSGGVMLPNHSPLTIAEQFGTLETLHPGRIDLGLGRAPGTDQATVRALRRDPASAERFPEDVLELQAFLGDETLVPGVNAIPGRGTRVPLYILGSSMFGAQLAAHLGLPYAFASHFSPQGLQEAVRLYRTNFRPSQQCQEPYVIAAANVIAGATSEEAREQFELTRRQRVQVLFGRDGRDFTDEEIAAILASPQGAHVDQMLTYSGVGTPEEVAEFLAGFARHADADEIMVSPAGAKIGDRHRSLELTAQAYPPAGT